MSVIRRWARMALIGGDYSHKVCLNRNIAGHAPRLFFLFNFKYLHIMKKEELFFDEFRKQFKTGMSSTVLVLKGTPKTGIEKMLEGELRWSFWIMKNTPKVQGRQLPVTGCQKKRTHSSAWSDIQVPMDRGSFLQPH